MRQFKKENRHVYDNGNIINGKQVYLSNLMPIFGLQTYSLFVFKFVYVVEG